MKDIGASIAFRLQGTKSNRDAIGTAVTVEADGHRQTKYLKQVPAFCRNTKELFFGLGDASARACQRSLAKWSDARF